MAKTTRAALCASTALEIKGGAIVSNAIARGTITPTGAAGVKINSSADPFNGVYVHGKGASFTLRI
jgi:hypothetical protein